MNSTAKPSPAPLDRSPFAERLGHFAPWELLLFVPACFLLGRAGFSQTLYPLGIGAAFAATALFGERAAPAVAAALAGQLSATGISLHLMVPTLLALPLWGLSARAPLRDDARAGLLAFASALVVGVFARPFALALIGAVMAAVAAMGLLLVLRSLVEGEGLGRQGATAALLFLMVFGLSGIHPWGVPAGYALSVLMAFLALRQGQRPALVAALAGGILFLTHQTSAGGAFDLVLATVLGGLASPFGALPMAGVFFSGNMVLAAFQEPAGLMLGQLGALTAGLAAGLWPSKRLEGLFRDREAAVAADPARPAHAADLAHLFSELAERFGERGLHKAPARPVDASLAVLEESVCRRCRFHHVCWRDDFYRTYRGLLGLVTREGGPAQLRRGDLPPHVLKICPHPRDVALALTVLRREILARRGLTEALGQAQEVLSRELHHAAELLLAEGAPERAPRLTYRTGLAKLVKEPGGISGDYYRVREISGQRLLVGLADGMGVGRQARTESAQAMQLLERLLHLGAPAVSACHTVNAALVARGSEAFSTLDVVLIDLVDAGAVLLKLGAAPSFVKSGRRVDVVHPSSLPVGMVEEVTPAVVQRRLEPGDWLVQITDGVLTGISAESLAGFLSSVNPLGPQDLAEDILDLARRSVPGEVRDDLTVLVVEIDVAAAGRPEIHTWIRRSSPVAGIGMDQMGKTGARGGKFPGGDKPK